MRLRLIFSFALIALISIASMSMIAHFGAAQEVRAFMFPGGLTRIETLAGALEEYYRTHQSWEGVESLLHAPLHTMMNRGQGKGPGVAPNMAFQRLRLADSTGNILFDNQDISSPKHLSATELENASSLKNGEQIVGYLLVEGGLDFTRNDEAFLIGRINRAALWAGLIAGGLSLLLALLLAHHLLRPVRALTFAARRLAEGDLSQRVPVSGDDELATLGQTFNQMANSLQRAEESRRAMTADIAHELRTPLSVQRANLEALQDGIYPLTPDNLIPILEQNHLLTHLVEDLRTLALADAGQLSIECVPTRLAALVERVVERFRPQAALHQIEIELAGELSDALRPDPLPLDPLRIEQLLNNLLSNALRHTPNGGRIVISGATTSATVQLAIHDSGPGIPPEALPQIFERFYRADKSRSRAEGGIGLGLAIARQLAIAHGGTLTAANHPAGGAVFTLSLPIPPNPRPTPTH